MSNQLSRRSSLRVQCVIHDAGCVSQHPAVLIAERADRPLMRGQRAAKRARTNKRRHCAQ